MIEKKLSKAEFESEFEKLFRTDKPIIIFGAGEIGRRAIMRMEYLGLKQNIACLGDNNIDKIGTKLEDILILSKSDISKSYPNAQIVITVGNCEIAQQIKEDLVGMGFQDFISRQALLHRFEFDGHREKALVKHDRDYILRQIVVSITEKCTLRCKHCSQLMPRFEKPIHTDVTTVVESLRRLTNMITYVQDVTLLGGEPLLHPDLPLICEEVGKMKDAGKIKFVNIVSNATIIPNDKLLAVMKKYGITIMFSDYGILSKKMGEAQEACDKAGVQWRYAYAGGKNEEKIQSWSDIGTLEKQNFSEEQINQKFAQCNSVYDCNMLYRGRYYFCSFSAFLTGLGMVEMNDDSFDLMREDISFEEMKKKYHSFMEEEKTINACYYCNMHGEVPVAEQI